VTAPTRTASSAPRPPQPDGARPWAALAALCVGFFLLMMDTTITNVAVPALMSDLDIDLNQVSWVNSVYLLAYAVPLLLSGRLGDRLGRKPMYVTGLVLFTVASLLCGLATGPVLLIAGRALQGIGAATMAPQTMAFIAQLFPTDRRGAALGIWAAVGGVATAIGPLLGGLFVDTAGWEWIFWVNVPIGVAGLFLAAILVPGGVRGAPRGERERFDVLGTLLSCLGLLALVFAVQNGEYYHWSRVAGPLTVTHLIVLGALLLVAFVVRQHFFGQPLIPLSLFKHRDFSAACVGGLAVGFALTGLYLPLTLYLQTARGYSPFVFGLITLPLAVAAGVVGPFSGRLSDRVSGARVAMGGFLAFGCGIAALAVTARAATPVWAWVLALTLCGVGTGSLFSPLANVATREIPGPVMGAASGVYNTARQVGSVFGSAAVSVLLQRGMASAGDGSDTGAVADAVSGALWLPVGMLVLGMLACLAMRDGTVRVRRSET